MFATAVARAKACVPRMPAGAGSMRDAMELAQDLLERFQSSLSSGDGVSSTVPAPAGAGLSSLCVRCAD